MVAVRAVPGHILQQVNELKIDQISKAFLSYGKSDAVEAVGIVQSPYLLGDLIEPPARAPEGSSGYPYPEGQQWGNKMTKFFKSKYQNFETIFYPRISRTKQGPEGQTKPCGELRSTTDVVKLIEATFGKVRIGCELVEKLMRHQGTHLGRIL